MKLFEKNKKWLTTAALKFVVVTIFFGGLLRKSYNADTITYMVYPQDSADVRLRAGRYLIALFDSLMNRVGIKTTDLIPICVLISMLLLTVSITILQSIFEDYCISDNLICVLGFNLSLTLVFCNVLFIENFMFTEMTVFIVLGYFLATVGILYYIRSKKITAVLYFALAVCLYQIAVVYAAVTLVFYYMLSNDFVWTKKAVLEEIFSCIIPMYLGAVDMIAIKIVGIIYPDLASVKPLNSIGVTEKIQRLLASCVMFMKDSYTLLPGLYIPGLVLLLAVGVTSYLLFKNKGGLAVLYYVVALCGSLIVIFAIPFVGDGFVFPPRMSFLMYLFMGLVLMTTIALLSKNDIKNLLELLSVVAMACVWLQIIFGSFIVSGRYVSNTLDRVYSRIILEEIEKYEEENGVTVTKLGVTTDAYAPAFYEESKTHYEQINERIMGLSTRSMFEAWWGRHFDSANGVPSEIYEKHFSGKDWDYFDVNEQLVIDGDTAYICVY